MGRYFGSVVELKVKGAFYPYEISIFWNCDAHKYIQEYDIERIINRIGRHSEIQFIYNKKELVGCSFEFDVGPLPSYDILLKHILTSLKNFVSTALIRGTELTVDDHNNEVVNNLHYALDTKGNVIEL